MRREQLRFELLDATLDERREVAAGRGLAGLVEVGQKALQRGEADAGAVGELAADLEFQPLAGSERHLADDIAQGDLLALAIDHPAQSAACRRRSNRPDGFGGNCVGSRHADEEADGVGVKEMPAQRFLRAGATSPAGNAE